KRTVKGLPGAKRRDARPQGVPAAAPVARCHGVVTMSSGLAVESARMDDLRWPYPHGQRRCQPRKIGRPLQRWIPGLGHVHLTALLITNGNADFCIRMRRRDSLTSA